MIEEIEMDERGVIVGQIIQGDIKVAFVGDGFKFTFIAYGENITLEVDDCGYIWGKTDDNKVIAIFVRQSFRISQSRVIYTWNYILSSCAGSTVDLMKHFRGIRFENGGIKSIFPCNALRRNWEVEDRARKENNSEILAYEIFPDTKELHISSQDFMQIKKIDYSKYRKIDCTWKFSSRIMQRISMREGITLQNTTSVLDIMFEEDKDYTTFYDFFGYLRTILSFMTFRSEVGFEKVYLLKQNPERDSLNDFAECFIKSSNAMEETRTFNEVIHIWTVTEDIFKHLFISAVLHNGKYGNGEYAPLPISILSTSRKNLYKITPSMIKEICSCLEVELDSAGIGIEKGNEFKQLVNEVKSVVKKHCGGENPLEKGVYDQIFGSIKHWGDSLADRAIKAWNEYKEELKPFVSQTGFLLETDEMNEPILELIKARNSITHSGFSDFDEDVKEAAFLMYGLIYVLALVRLGFDREFIEDLMRQHFIV